MEILAGFLIAVAISLSGIGGGVITTPVLMLFFGLPPVEAVATALTFVAIVKLFAAPAYAWRGQVSWQALRALLMGGVPGVVTGSLLLHHLKVGELQPVILLLVGVTVVYFSGTEIISRLRGSRAPLVVPARQLGEAVRSGNYRLLGLCSLFIGLEVGFTSAGAGVLGTTALLKLTTLTPATVVGTDLMFGLVISAVGSGVHLSLGTANLPVLMKLLAGGLVGVLAGTRLARMIPATAFRFGLCLWLVYLGSQLFYRGAVALIRGGF